MNLTLENLIANKIDTVLRSLENAGCSFNHAHEAHI
jgi:hypothetical protein